MVGNVVHALHALCLRAQLVVVNHFMEALHARSQRQFSVLVEEKLGIGQPRAHHALVTAHHGRSIGRVDIADHQKVVRQHARCIEQRKVLLIGLHGQNQALLRHA